jgi:hypothetical protein
MQLMLCHQLLRVVHERLLDQVLLLLLLYMLLSIICGHVGQL